MLLSSAGVAQQGSQPVVVTDLTKIVQLSNLVSSPNGRWVAYTAQSVEAETTKPGEYTYRTQLWLVPSDGSRPPRQLTQSTQSSTSPQWLDNDRIAFTRSVEGKPQVFVLSLSGGEAIQLTKEAQGVSGARFSPDGKWILFSRSVPHHEMVRKIQQLPPWPLERPGLNSLPDTITKPDPDGDLAAVRAWLNKNADTKSPKVIFRLNFQGETDLTPDWSYNHLYKMSADGNSPAIALTTGFFSWSNGQWSPDGQYIVFSGNPDSTQHPDRRQGNNALYRIKADGSELVRLLRMDGYSLSNPEYAPDGKMIAFSASENKAEGYNPTRLGVAASDGSQARMLSMSLDRSISDLQWAADNQRLYVTASANGGTPLYQVTLSGKISAITSTDTGVRSYLAHRQGFVVVLTTAVNPYEVMSMNTSGGNMKALSEHNSAWLSTKRVSIPQKATLKRPDGLDVEYWIIKPAFAEPGKKYPLVLNIHGGPSAMWGTGEPSMWHEFQFFASKNYGTVFANPRGSGGYGFDFQYANYQNWGAGPAGDVLAAVDEALKQDWVDPNQLVITGGSYAGYLTAWIIAHDHRFKAAFAQRGVYDLDTFMGEGNAWRLVPNHFGGYPWEDAIEPILERESPITFVDQIKTPLLIKHGDVDLRTGVIQSEMLYKSLKILGKEVEYVRVPNASHELSRSGNVRHRIDRILRIWEFFERYVGE